MSEAKSYAEEIVELTKKNERLFLETLNELAEAKVKIKAFLEKQEGLFCERRTVDASNSATCSCKRTRTDAVRDMFVQILPNQERNDRPTVPSEAAIRLQTRIDCEEFVEKIEALYDDAAAIAQLKYMFRWFSERSPIRKDLHDRLPEFADALADNAVTNEGFAVLFGIDLEPVFHEVHAANMRKKDGPIDASGKRGKPEGWTPPDVAGTLQKQGWQPSSESGVDDPIPYKLSCDIHGMIFGGGHECVRCENAQYNGSEIDPIGEESVEPSSVHSPQSLFATWTGDPNANVDALTASGRSRWKKLADVLNGRKFEEKVDPIGEGASAPRFDISLWNTDERVDCESALVIIDGRADVYRVAFLHGKGDRRLLIEMLANDGIFGFWMRKLQDECSMNISIECSFLGPARVVSIERGVMRSDGSYLLQVEFVRATSKDD